MARPSTPCLQSSADTVRELEYSGHHDGDGRVQAPRSNSQIRPFALCELKQQTPGRVKKVTIHANGCLDLRPIMQGMPDYFKIDELTVRLGMEVMCLCLHQVPITKLTLVGLLPLLDPPADDDLLERVREWPTTRACWFELPALLEELRLEGCSAGVFGQGFFSTMARLEGAGNEHGMPCHVFLGWCGARPVLFFFAWPHAAP